mgnify:FL=1
MIEKNTRTFIPVIYDCNNNCISCPVPIYMKRENPTFEEIILDIDKISNYSNHIEFNGGEPTIRKDMIKILKYCESKDFQEISILTNVEMLSYEDYVKKLSKIRNLKIITTLYGHNSKIHDAITKTPGSFERKIKGIKNLIKYGINIELRILLHKMNYKHFNELTDFLIKLTQTFINLF